MIRGGAVGDFAVTLPLLAALRARFPGERLAVLAQPGVTPLASAAGLADEARSLEAAELATFFAPGSGALSAEWAEWFAGFARIVSFLHGQGAAAGIQLAWRAGGARTASPLPPPAAVCAANRARAGARTLVAGPARPRPGGGRAASQLAAPAMAALGLPPLRPEAFRLCLDASLLAEAGAWLGPPPLLALHPGSGSPRKNWPAEKWVELGRAVLAGQPGQILVLGGEADAAPLAALREALPPERVRFVENAPLPRVAALLASSPRFVGHDSGLGHLAAAVGAECLLLFGGASDPAVWAPPQPNARALQAPEGDLARLEIAVVRTELER